MACMSCMSNQFLIDNWQQTDKNVWRNKCKYTPFHLYNRDLSLSSYEERGMASPHPSDVTSSVSHLPSHISISCLHIVSTQNVVTRNLWKTWSKRDMRHNPPGPCCQAAGVLLIYLVPLPLGDTMSGLESVQTSSNWITFHLILCSQNLKWHYSQTWRRWQCVSVRKDYICDGVSKQ